jgi:hypothetical protein
VSPAPGGPDGDQKDGVDHPQPKMLQVGCIQVKLVAVAWSALNPIATNKTRRESGAVRNPMGFHITIPMPIVLFACLDRGHINLATTLFCLLSSSLCLQTALFPLMRVNLLPTGSTRIILQATPGD